MVASCAVCDEPIPGGAQHCPKCGFPTALAGTLGGPLPPATTSDAPRAEPELQGTGPETTASPETEVNAALARGLEERMELLQRIDRDAPDATGALCEAALNEASGRVSDAQQILRSAQGRLDRETEELLARHLASLEARGQALEATGLRLALEDELGRLAQTIVEGDAASAIGAMATAERRLEGIEAHWRGLQALFAQVTTLRQDAASLGIDLSVAPDRLEAVRRGLATLPVTERDLDVAAQAAADSLMRLHEAIPPALEQELGRHAASLDAHRGRPGRVRSARLLHTEAVGHLKSGRLQEAVQGVRELRQALEELAKEVERLPPPEPVAAVAADPPVTPVAPVGVTGPPPVAEGSVPPPHPAPAARPTMTGSEVAAVDAAAMLALLTKKAKSLAVRVRSLPAESEEAQAAARHIHEATELLRARRFEEADAALTRLMRLLAAAQPQS